MKVHLKNSIEAYINRSARETTHSLNFRKNFTLNNPLVKDSLSNGRIRKSKTCQNQLFRTLEINQIFVAM